MSEVPSVAFSMWQPWASLVVLGHKTIETRTWVFPAKYEGKRVAIHAGRRLVDPDEIEEIEYPLGKPLPIDHSTLPFGCLIGSVLLVRVVGLWGEPDEPHGWRGGVLLPGTLQKTTVSRQELAFGNYADGRFGWTLAEPDVFDKPIPFRGMQGFFSTTRCPVPSSLFDMEAHNENIHM